MRLPAGIPISLFVCVFASLREIFVCVVLRAERTFVLC
jgi:hypothetical protein